MQKTMLAVLRVRFILSVLFLCTCKAASSSSIDRSRLADHPTARKAKLISRHSKTDNDVSPQTSLDRTVGSSMVRKNSSMAAVGTELQHGHSASVKPNRQTVRSRPVMSQTVRESRRLMAGNCEATSRRMTIRHAISSTVSCQRTYVVKMCKGYCESYMAPIGRRATVHCSCCRGQIVLEAVSLLCGDAGLIVKKVPAVQGCTCRPCALAVFCANLRIARS